MQGPFDLPYPPSESHQPCSSDSDPHHPQTMAKTHIASCIRPDADVAVVYISQAASSETPRDAHSPRPSLSKSSSLINLSQTSSHQLCPKNLSPLSHSNLSSEKLLSDKADALSVARSSTSLSDTAILPATKPFWQRGAILARRRKISVPELGNAMTTVPEMAVDSPTIPGRPALRNMSVDAASNRYANAPSSKWRSGPFGDALMDRVTGPSPVRPQLQTSVAPSMKQLSPILSPGASYKPSLKVETSKITQESAMPPRVPRRLPTTERRRPLTPVTGDTRTSKMQITTPAVFNNASNAPSPSSARGSPRVENRDSVAAHMSSHNRNQSDSSVMDRGRPKRRSEKCYRSRTVSESNNPEAPAPSSDTWNLPRGMRVPDASRHMSDTEKRLLHKQAYEQAGNFKVLKKRDVASLSRELRALDERCEYLHKTYKSLRAGRHKLHGRMIAYLKRGETIIFSRESLLKQEESLAELDVSIDEFILKLEQAENRRLRLRQKLLEHVAAAIILIPYAGDMAETTPPLSPAKPDSSARPDPKDTESIKIYADGHILNLFSDIEKAIGKMYEQAC